ncbi:MAG: hypothetical protein WCG28_04710 [bacterium]
MKNPQKIFALVIGIVVILAIGGWLYFQFSIPTFPPSPTEREIAHIKYGTPEQKEEALDFIRFKVEKYNVATIPQEEQTKISEITPFIPYVIEAILDSTSLPRHEDTGWGNVSHYANTVMNMFAYRFDRVQRAKDPKFSFNDVGLPIDETERIFVHDNWLNWWKSTASYTAINFNGLARCDVGKTNVCLGNQVRNIEYNGHFYKVENLASVEGIKDGTNVKVGGTTREEIKSVCAVNGLALPDSCPKYENKTFYYIIIKTIEEIKLPAKSITPTPIVCKENNPPATPGPIYYDTVEGCAQCVKSIYASYCYADVAVRNNDISICTKNLTDSQMLNVCNEIYNINQDRQKAVEKKDWSLCAEGDMPCIAKIAFLLKDRTICQKSDIPSYCDKVYNFLELPNKENYELIKSVLGRPDGVRFIVGEKVF